MRMQRIVAGLLHTLPMWHTPSKAALFFNLKQRNTQ